MEDEVELDDFLERINDMEQELMEMRRKQEGHLEILPILRLIAGFAGGDEMMSLYWAASGRTLTWAASELRATARHQRGKCMCITVSLRGGEDEAKEADLLGIYESHSQRGWC